MKNIFVIRHCSAQGQNDDAPLTGEGILQAKALSNFLQDKGIEKVISSPSERAIQTIAPFMKKNGVEMSTDSRLRERVLSTRNLDNWRTCLEDTFRDRDLRFDGGETSNEATARSYSVAREVISTDYGTVALVTHGNLMSLLLGVFDSSFGFEGWTNLSNPDVYLVRTDGVNHEVKRVWNENR